MPEQEFATLDSMVRRGEIVLPDSYFRGAKNALDGIDCVRPCFFGKSLNSIHGRFSRIIDKIKRAFSLQSGRRKALRGDEFKHTQPTDDV